jgi:hypothetical protein
MIFVSKDGLNTLQTTKQTIHYTNYLFKLSFYAKETAAICIVVLALTALKNRGLWATLY